MNTKTVYHESYGHLPESTLRLIRRFNVSPADFDLILDTYMYKVGTEPTTAADWIDVDEHIKANSVAGYYRMTFF